MIELTTVILVLAGLLAVISGLQPIAEKLKAPPTVLLAVVGIAIGAMASFLLYTPLTDRFNDIVEPVVHFPVKSTTFIYVFLPLLLFQAALTIDVPRMIEDAPPILLLAVVAVVVTTGVIGFAMSSLFGMSLIACLLLGSIVATTDPAAVVTIFRDIGAPARLVRLVEGESLLNDAAAISLFTLLMALLLRGKPLDPIVAAREFVVVFVGGAVFGVAAGKALVTAIRLIENHKAAEATLTLATPYAVFIVGDHTLHVSGVVAVVTLGLSVSAWGRGVFLPENWRHLLNVWDQIAFWAASLIFLMASITIPKLLADVRPFDAVMILALVAAAMAARAIVLFLLLPLLSLTRVTKPIDLRYKTAILWGGLRGAVTLALALSVVEHRSLAPDIKRFVAVMATGFVLFTLLVNGFTLSWVIRVLRLDMLSPIDRALRDQVLALSLADVRDVVQDTGKRYGVAPPAVRPVVRGYDARIERAMAGDGSGETSDALQDRERFTVALVTLADRERDLIVEHHGHETFSRPVVDKLLRHADRIVELARAEGRFGYNRAARRALDFRLPFRLAHLLHRRAHIDWPLARQLSDRFESLLALHLVLEELKQFVEARLKPLFGPRIAELLEEVLSTRSAATSKALAAMRLQYPAYAEALERRFLKQVGLREEVAQYEMLRQEGLLRRELYDSLKRGVRQEQGYGGERPKLDLGLDTRQLVAKIDLFRGLNYDDVGKICKLFRPRVAVPGEVIVRRGDRGDSVFFISSGAVEVKLPGQGVSLGRGDFFGELALLSRRRRAADVVALTYCQLLVLDEARFRRFLDLHPAIHAHVEAVATARAGKSRFAEDDEPLAADRRPWWRRWFGRRARVDRNQATASPSGET